MGEEKVQIVATAQDRASPALKNLKRNVQSLGNSRSGPLGGVISGFAGMYGPALIAGAAVGVFAGALANGVAGALAEEKQLVRLDQALTNNVKNWDGNRDAIDRATTAAMDFAFSDDEARESLIKLLPATHNATDAIKDMRLAMDIARGRNIDLGAATDIVIKATMGNTGALRKMGIEIEKGASAQDILNQLQATYAGQANQYANTTAGKFESAQKKVDNAMEDVGHTVIETAAGFMDFGDAMKGDTDAQVDFLRAVSNLIPPVGILADEVERVRDAMLPKNIIGPTKKPVIEEMIFGSGNIAVDDLWRTKLQGVDQAVKHGEEVGRRLGEALADGLTDDLVGTLRSNKKSVRDVMKEITWALRHPEKAIKEVGRIEKVLSGDKLAKLLGADDPVSRQIGLQLQQKLEGMLTGITGVASPATQAAEQARLDYQNYWNTHLPQLNPPSFPTFPGGASRPRLPVMGAGGDLGPGESAIVGERGRAEVFTAGKHGGRVTPIGGGGGHGHAIVLNGRVLGQAVDEYLGRQLSRTPSGIVSRG